jgi:vacuolar-type H+-ATPase subunit H
MDAFADIMKAEEEALQAIESAKKKASEELTKAKEAKAVAIQKTEADLQARSQSELASFSEQIKVQADSIASDVHAEVTAINDKFSQKADAVTAEVIKQLS